MEETEFEVTGAGKIRISNTADISCAGKHGFSIGVSWGRYGFAGGVIEREDARKLAEHILSVLSKSPDTD